MAATKEYNPPLLPTSNDLFYTSKIRTKTKDVTISLSSFDLRSQQTAQLISQNHETTPLLTEIKYSMSDLLPKEKFYKNGTPDVDNARKTFVNNLISDKLEPYYSVTNRVKDLLVFLDSLPDIEIVCVTHGFYLKVIEAYIRDQDIIKNPNKLLQYFDGKTETFKFFEGFEVSQKYKIFIFESYIRNT
jgi:broad specificity phosphatase PhoE